MIPAAKKTICLGVLYSMMSVALAAQPLGCLIEPFRVADVGSPVTGVIESVQVERGDRVVKGQVLATLRADVERAAVGVAYNRAQALGDYNAAVNNAELARQKLVRAKNLANQQFISPQALEQATTESEIANSRMVQAREQRGVLAGEHSLAQAQLAQRTVRSPTNGVVADRYLSAGERVEEKAVFRIAVVDPLRVEIVLPSNVYGTLREGMTMGITPEFAGAGVRRARVVLVDKLIDGASNTFRVRLELPNPGLTLPAGLRCKADLASVTGVDVPAPSPARAARVSADLGLALRMEPVLSTVKAPKP
jgi:RND family efflux transporter MFP subunit